LTVGKVPLQSVPGNHCKAVHRCDGCTDGSLSANVWVFND
jgi:hypothetical protein